MVKAYLMFSFGLIALVAKVAGECRVIVRENSPIFVKDYGSKRIRFTEKYDAQITLNGGESVNAHCSTSMRFQSRYTVFEESGFIKSSEFACTPNNKVIYKTSADHDFKEINEDRIYVSCSGEFHYDLYESRRIQPNCNYLSYAIGLALPNMKDIITAGVCYDLDNLTLKYVNYIAYSPKYEFVTQQHTTNLQTVTLDLKLDHIETYFNFMSQADFKISFENKQLHHPTLHQFHFDFMSLVQDAPMLKKLNDFSNIFNIMWWRNLRLGSWKLFLNALKERSKEVNYIAYTGTDGEISLPSATCNESETLYVESSGIRIKAPEYIWSYLKSTSANASEEFVVVGINSPYYQVASDAIFCVDMCEEIDWLKTSLFENIRLMPTMGVVFCCHPEEVANKFNNFPIVPKTPQQVTFKLESVPTSTSSVALNEVE